MRIKKFHYQYRRDFTAEFECEHCGEVQMALGYDDDYFHREVVPKMKCPKCGKTAGLDFRPMGTLYPEGQVV
ncbi:MAG: hypothetical protein PHI12_10900 [Dehalococcoidales bacterium]|nr:hypothetical protein [Dehalococcoidales bacterium]